MDMYVESYTKSRHTVPAEIVGMGGKNIYLTVYSEPRQGMKG